MRQRPWRLYAVVGGGAREGTDDQEPQAAHTGAQAPAERIRRLAEGPLEQSIKRAEEFMTLKQLGVELRDLEATAMRVGRWPVRQRTAVLLLALGELSPKAQALEDSEGQPSDAQSEDAHRGDHKDPPAKQRIPPAPERPFDRKRPYRERIRHQEGRCGQ